MRSLSRVIKGSHLQINEPRLIQLAEIVELKAGEESWEGPVLCNAEHDQLRHVQEETQRILQETEQMVIDLLQRARAEAREIMENASDEADLIRSRAVQEAKTLREQARQEGFDEGLMAARDAMEGERLLAQEQREELLREAYEIKRKMFRDSEADMIRLCLAVAKKVVAAELTANPQIVAGILQEALTYLDQPEKITLHVNQKDVEMVLGLIQSGNLFDMGNKPVLEVQADTRVSPGGLRMESECGSVDARIETRWANIERSFQEVLNDE